MPKAPELTQAQRESITAALFRREDTHKVAADHGISERSVRRMVSNLRQYGTVTTPRLKKMGRPTVLTPEVEKDLKSFVTAHPLALLSDMQRHLQSKHNLVCSRASISRRLTELGFARGMIRKGVRSPTNCNVSDTAELATLSAVDYERIRREAEEEEMVVLDGEGNGITQHGVILVNREDRDKSQAGSSLSDAPSMDKAGGDGESVYSKRTKFAWLTDRQPARKPKQKCGAARGDRGEVGREEPIRPIGHGQVDQDEDEGTAGASPHSTLHNDASRGEVDNEAEMQPPFTRPQRLGQYVQTLGRSRQQPSPYPPLHGDGVGSQHAPSNVSWFE